MVNKPPRKIGLLRMPACTFFAAVKSFSKILMLVLPAFFLMTGCHQKKHAVKTAFYYWKTVYSADKTVQKTMRQLGSTRVYLRCFDIDWNEATTLAQPVAIVRLPGKMDSTISYVPVVFITQKAIATLTLKGTVDLAKNTSDLLADLCRNSGIIPTEIQIDCDWTTTSKDTYFDLLKRLHQQDFLRDKILSSTIRLHQIKYKLRSGIPPCDRGMLMLYNIGNLKQSTAQNSILDVRLAKDYLAHLDSYPLPLDVALPIFNWCLLFRNNVFAGIIRDATPSELKTPLFTQTKAGFYRVENDTLWHDYGLRAGDIIRAESPAVEDLRQVAAFSSAHLKNVATTIAFFGADSIALNHYSTNELQTILDAYN